MSWWGKVLGGAFGFMLGGPLGALLGASIGHSFDTGLERSAADNFGNTQERIQTAFFTATFSIMGHIAKADGRVSEDEIRLARAVMDEMQLSSDQKQAAIALFNQGKSSDFPLDDVVDQLRRECHRRHTLIQMFLEIQLHAAYADGHFHTIERKILSGISEQLGFSGSEFHHLEALVKNQRFFSGKNQEPAKQKKDLLKEAYKILDVDENAPFTEIKKAYRRLMNQHHPDKLVAKGLPEEMIKLATDRTHEIRSAYEIIRKEMEMK
ncbi:MAG: co-chaperone DjlA [Gammaproteobacteria bacterium]|nr:co-chaperone DjlA [Gammaproteobacteria bacterium]